MSAYPVPISTFKSQNRLTQRQLGAMFGLTQVGISKMMRSGRELYVVNDVSGALQIREVKLIATQTSPK